MILIIRIKIITYYSLPGWGSKLIFIKHYLCLIVNVNVIKGGVACQPGNPGNRYPQLRGN